jgi:iron complex transport system ATP-binding protein
VLDAGRLKLTGPPARVLIPGLIEAVFGVRAHVGEHLATGRPHITLASLL